jgi:hypothetical protein
MICFDTVFLHFSPCPRRCKNADVATRYWPVHDAQVTGERQPESQRRNLDLSRLEGGNNGGGTWTDVMTHKLALTPRTHQPNAANNTTRKQLAKMA